MACGIKFPDQGLNLGPLHWEHGVPGPPGKSHSGSFYDSWLVALGKEASSPPMSLFLGTEASRSCLACSALLPLAWNVNKPASKTKTQPSAPGRGRPGQRPREAHHACPSFPGRSCSPGWSPLSHTSHLCPSSYSYFSGGEK